MLFWLFFLLIFFPSFSYPTPFLSKQYSGSFFRFFVLLHLKLETCSSEYCFSSVLVVLSLYASKCAYADASFPKKFPGVILRTPPPTHTHHTHEGVTPSRTNPQGECLDMHTWRPSYDEHRLSTGLHPACSYLLYSLVLDYSRCQNSIRCRPA